MGRMVGRVWRGVGRRGRAWHGKVSWLKKTSRVSRLAIVDEEDGMTIAASVEVG